MAKNLCSVGGILTELPEELRYIGDAALRYRLDSDDAVFSLLQSASEADYEGFAILADRVLICNHYPLVLRFLDRYPIDEYEESAWLYFLFGLLDYADLKFD